MFPESSNCWGMAACRHLNTGDWYPPKVFFIPDCESPCEELEGQFKLFGTFRLAIINKNCILWTLSVDLHGWDAHKWLPRIKTRPTNKFCIGYKITAPSIATKQSSERILKGSSETVSTSQALSILRLLISHSFWNRKIQSLVGELSHMVIVSCTKSQVNMVHLNMDNLKDTDCSPALSHIWFFFKTYSPFFEPFSLSSHWSCLLPFSFFPFPLFTFMDGNLIHWCWNMQSAENLTM